MAPRQPTGPTSCPVSTPGREAGGPRGWGWGSGRSPQVCGRLWKSPFSGQLSTPWRGAASITSNTEVTAPSHATALASRDSAASTSAQGANSQVLSDEIPAGNKSCKLSPVCCAHPRTHTPRVQTCHAHTHHHIRSRGRDPRGDGKVHTRARTQPHAPREVRFCTRKSVPVVTHTPTHAHTEAPPAKTQTVSAAHAPPGQASFLQGGCPKQGRAAGGSPERVGSGPAA